MCSFGSSNNSAPTSQYSTQTTVAAPQAQAMYNQAWNQAQTTAQRPFQPYSYDPSAFVAPMNSTQLTAVNNLYQQQQAGQPYYQAAPGMAYAAGNTSAAGLAPSYMSPYLDSVAASTMGWLGQQQAQQQNQLSGEIAKNGQWGNDRSGIERAILSGQQNMATNSAMSNLYNQGYNTALGAAQTDLTRQLQAAQNLAGQGQTATGSLLQAGTLGQQTQQQGLQALYNQYMMQQQYPFQVAQFLSSTAAGLGPGYGSTTSGMQSAQQPLSYFGNPLSDPRLKTGAGGEEPEIIGQTNDGQDIYRYRLMDPDTGRMGPPQIGLMADEVAQRRPDAIGDYKGFRTVDYKKATDDAARMGGGVMGRGDYAEGGLVSIVPQDFKMPTAHLDTPTLHYMTPPEREKSNLLGDLGSSAKNLLDLYKTGKEAKGIYDDWGKGDSKMAGDASGKASGGSVYDQEPEMTQGPTGGLMPTASLKSPTLRFASDKSDEQEGGLGSTLKSAAGIAGSLKTLWDIGSTVGPMLMSLSDPRLKTGVRPARKAGGGGLSATDLFDYLVNEKGADPREAAVLTSGAGVESSFNPNAVHDKGTGYGLWGHRLDRYDAMKKFTGLDRPDWHGQADFALDEFRHRPEHKMAMASNDPEALTRAQMFYERPAGFSTAHPEAGKYYDRRLALTQQLLNGGGKGGGLAPMALRAPEDRPRNAGLDAIDAATRGAPKIDYEPTGSVNKGGLQPSAAAPEGISGMIRGTPASGLGEKALDFATSERFLVPLLTGLGTMASSGSRYLAPAILEGLGAGAKAYMEVPKVQSEIMKNTLGIAAQRFKPLENGNFYDNVLGREVSSQERGSAISGMFSGTLGGIGGLGAPAPYSTPSEKAPEIDAATRTAKEVSAPAAPPPAGTEPTKGEDTGASGKVSEIMTRATKDPSVMALMKKANDYEAEANRLQKMPYVEGASERASAYRSLAQQYRTQALDIRNKIAEPDIAAVKTEQEKKISSKYETVTVEPAPGEPARIVTKDQVIAGAGVPKNAPVAKQPEAVAKQQAALAESKVAMAQNAQARQNVRERLNTLKEILSTYETGKFAEQKADFVATLRAIGFPVSDMDTASPEKFQEFVKNATATIFQQAAGLGGPVLKSELEGLAKANPNPTMQPGANRQILGQALGLLDWEDKHYNDFVDWTEKNPYAYDASKFERDWLKANPTKGYVKKATLGIAAKGESIPPRDKLEIGYTTVRDGVKWQWDGKQFVRVQ